MSQPLIAPSIISADFTRLGDEIRAAGEAGADRLHLDVMDGHFVPNITFGPLVSAAARRVTRLPLDVHLMISEPDRFLEDFISAGADTVSVHLEACPHLHRTLQRIRELGAECGVAINPHTPVEALAEVIPLCDLVVLMSVNPGFGGQRYLPESTGKIARLRELLRRHGSSAPIHVDGGIGPDTAAEAARAGAGVLVAGSAIFGSKEDVAANLRRLRAAAAG
ncbi:MAG: ribulose-phosphate 3-epimerase [Longimicrobiaceae bacterium]